MRRRETCEQRDPLPYSLPYLCLLPLFSLGCTPIQSPPPPPPPPKFQRSRSEKSSTAMTAEMHMTKTSITMAESTGNSAAPSAAAVSALMEHAEQAEQR